MSDPIEQRMTADERAEYYRLREQGYALLRQAHEIHQAAYKRESK